MSKSTRWRILLSALFAAFCNISYTFACHAIALVNPTSQVLANGTGLEVTASSDSPTCGCAVYWLDVEVRCNSANDPFTGGPFQPGIWVPYNSYPYYQSAQMQKPNCVVQQYPWVTISYANLCPGGTYKYRLRENHNGQVGPWTSVFTFTVPGNPAQLSVTASAVTTTLCVGQNTQLNSSITGGCSNNPTISWSPTNGLSNPNIANPVATPTQTTTYTVTYTDPCSGSSTSASVTITVNPASVAGTASISPTSICAGQTVTLTLTGYTGNIQWQSAPSPAGPWTNIGGANSSPYTTGAINATTFFHAVVTGCGTATSNNIAVAVTPAPNVTVTPNNPSICAGASVTFTASGATSYSWNTTPVTTGSSLTVNPSATTSYVVTGTTNNCSTTRTVTVTVNPSPTANAGPDVTICSGQTTPLSGSGGVSCLWAPSNLVTVANSFNTTAIPQSTQTYVLLVTDANGCSNSDQVTVTVNPLPAVNAGPDVQICAGGNVQLQASGATGYSWSPSTGLSCVTCANPVASPSVTTTYIVTGTDANSCNNTDTIVVTVNQIPVANAGPDVTVCNNGSVTLTASGGTTYTWLPNNSTLSCSSCQQTIATPTVNTTYTVIAANGSCTSTDSVNVTMSSIITTTVVVTPPTCNGSCDGQAQVNIQGGQPNYTFSWSSGHNTNPVSGLCAGTYTVTVTDANGCTAVDSAVIVDPTVVTAAPAASPSTICIGQSSTLTGNPAGGTGSGYTFTWGPASAAGTLSCTSCASPVASPTVTTTYNVVATDANGCQSAPQTVTVTVNPPLGVNMSGTASICAGNTTPLGVYATGGNGGPYNYVWAPASTLSCSTCQNPNATPNGTTTYTVTVTDNCGTPLVIDSVTVSVLPPLNVSFVVDNAAGCAPLCVTFSDNTTPQSTSWTWDFGDGSPVSTQASPSHCYNASGSYNVTLSVIDVNGCPGTQTYNNMITVHPIPTPGFIISPQPTTLLNPDITFTPDCISCDSCVYYIDTDSDVVVINNCTGFVYTFQDTGSFVVTQEVYSQYGCMATISHIVDIDPDFILYAPNAFTPNGDGLNDVFLPQGIGIDSKHYELTLFDRWGNLIFQTNNLDKGWDGTVHGNNKLVEEDAYVWKVVLQDIKGNKHSYMGHVSVIR